MRFGDVVAFDGALAAADVQADIDRISAVLLDGRRPMESRQVQRFGRPRTDQGDAFFLMPHIQKVTALGRKRPWVPDTPEPVPCARSAVKFNKFFWYSHAMGEAAGWGDFAAAVITSSRTSAS